MKINTDVNIPEVEVDMVGASDVSRQVLIGPDEDSENIIMRLFKIRPGGCTPHHKHNFEHVIKVLSGKGVAVDENGQKHQLRAGQNLFVRPNDMHQFRNPYSDPFEFLCIIPNPDKVTP